MTTKTLNMRMLNADDIQPSIDLLNAGFKRVFALLVKPRYTGIPIGQANCKRFYRPSTKVIVAENELQRLVGVIFFRIMGSRILAGPLSVASDHQRGNIVYQMRDYFLENHEASEAQNIMDFCTFAHSPIHLSQYWHFCNTNGMIGGPTFPFPLFCKNVIKPLEKQNTRKYDDIWMMTLSEVENIRLLNEIKKLSDKFYSGLDFSIEAKHVIENKIGNVLALTDANNLVAVAICHHGIGAETPTKRDLSIKYLFVDPTIREPRQAFEILMQKIENYAYHNKMKVISLLTNSQWEKTVNTLICLDYKLCGFEQGYSAYIDKTLASAKNEIIKSSFYQPNQYAAYELR